MCTIFLISIGAASLWKLGRWAVRKLYGIPLPTEAEKPEVPKEPENLVLKAGAKKNSETTKEEEGKGVNRNKGEKKIDNKPHPPLPPPTTPITRRLHRGIVVGRGTGGPR